MCTYLLRATIQPIICGKPALGAKIQQGWNQRALISYMTIAQREKLSLSKFFQDDSVISWSI